MELKVATATKESVIYFGIDFHKENTEVAVVAGEDGSIISRQRMPSDLHKIRQYVERNTRAGFRSRVCYEASGCGFGLYRHLVGHGIECEIIAPHTICCS